MSRRGEISAVAFVALLGLTPAARAADIYETGGPSHTDDTNQSTNTLSHGGVQQHELDQAGAAVPDQDWMVVPTIAGHSYEVRANGSARFDFGACPICAQLERVNAAGTVLTEDVSTVNESTGGGAEAYDRSIRWIAAASTTEDYIRVRGATDTPDGPGSLYTVRFWDTTYAIPRWNNANGQVTVIVVDSLIQAPTSVQIVFYADSGAVTTTSFQVQPNRVFVMNTSIVPSLLGKSGHAYVSHLAGYGGLAGKAISVEPATGFTFDTPFVPVLD